MPARSRWPGRRVTRAAVVALAVAAASCGGQGGAHRAVPLPSSPQVVDVSMREYAFGYVAPKASGRVVFRAHNDGEADHHLQLVTLADDLPPIDVQLRSPTRRVVTTLVYGKVRRPGQAITFAVDLRPGVRYALLCFVAGADKVPHAQKGMNSEFRAGPPRQGP